MTSLPGTSDPLFALGQALAARRYRFVTITPASHARVNSRPENAESRTVRDVFGWNRPFGAGVLDADLHTLADQAGVLLPAGPGRWRSAVRFSSLGDALYVHSSYPTHDEDAVFFGPDTYRFVALIKRYVRPAVRALDLGCGGGAGGLALTRYAEQIVLADRSALALRYAQVNCALAAAEHVQVAESDLFSALSGTFDLIVANPPYLADDAGRVYRDGGGTLGTGISERIVAEAIDRLRPGGRLILYTATPICNGEDPLAVAICPMLAGRPVHLHYEELDPDVFGEELSRPVYAGVERLALVAAILDRTL